MTPDSRARAPIVHHQNCGPARIGNLKGELGYFVTDDWQICPDNGVRSYFIRNRAASVE
jgi:hypothetical protein